MSPIYEAWQIAYTSVIHDEYSPSILSNLTLNKSVPKPSPGPGEVLVRLRAAALNFRDLLIIAASPNYPLHAAHNLSPCSDGAGSIEAVGANSSWNVGDEVILSPNQGWWDGDVSNLKLEKALGGSETQGTLQQYRVVPDRWLARKPKHLSWEEAAAMPTAGGTAVNALFHHGLVTSGLDLTGKTVLAQGTGGVSCYVVQIASRAGARVIATSSSNEKLEELKKMGAESMINYKETPKWGDQVLQLTGGRGVDLVVEVGGAGTIEESLKATRFSGSIVVLGILTKSQQADLIPAILYGAKRIRGSLASNKQMIEELVELVEQHQIQPVVGRVFEWSKAPEAFEEMMKQGTVGKIVIKI